MTTSKEKERDAYNRGVFDAKSGVLFAEGSKFYKKDKRLLPVYVQGFLAGKKGGKYA